MIEYLRLERWKAYRHLELDLAPGTTFLVARNGIGKTSLIEAAAFAVTGAVDQGLVIRAGAKDAEVEARIRLPDGALLSIVRTITMAGRKPDVSSRATLNGSIVADISTLLEGAWKAPVSFVARTAFVHESLHSATTEGMRDQLARAFGVAELQVTMRALDKAHDDLTKRATLEDRDLREANTDREQLIAACDLAEADLGVALAARDAARNFLNEVEASVRSAEEARRATDRKRAWLEEREGILRDVETTTSRQIKAGDLVAEVRSLDEQAQTDLSSLRGEITAIKTRIAIIEAAADELSRAGAACPVCRRPLDDQTHTEAAAAHRAEIEALRASLAAMREENHVARVSAVRKLSDRIAALGQEPEEAIRGATEFDMDADTARTRWQEAVEAAAVAQAEVDRAKASLVELDADQRRLLELRRLYRELALVEASRTAVESTVKRVLHERVEPLLSVVRQRWKALFPDRPDLDLDIDGKFSRAIGGVPLPFNSFSTGERAAAQLLLRLVLVEATTRTGMCWVDEPLEHLDPTSRRLVGGMLAHATTGTGERTLNLRQVFVSTYEEPLARRIADTIEDAHIVYVTASPAE